MSKTGSLDKESEKRLKDFFGKKSSVEKRWKSCRSFREQKGDSSNELKGFFQDHFHLVFTLLQDGVADFTQQASKGKRDVKYLDQIVCLMSDVVDLLPDLIGRQWQTKAIFDIMCNFLYKENKIELRLRGVEIYTKFLIALKPAETEFDQIKDILGLFGQSLLFQPFVVGGSVSFAFNALEAPTTVPVWNPGGTTTEADAESLLRKVLELVTKENGAQFEFAFELLKMNVFSVMYPKVFQQMGLLPKDQNTGFSECPAKLQRIVLSYVEAWMKDPTKVASIWGSTRNAQLMLEMYAQGVALGVGDWDVSSMVIRMFGSLFFSDKPAAEISSRLTDFCVFYLKKWVSVFGKGSDGNLAYHAKLCKAAVKVLVAAGCHFQSLDEQVQGLVLAVPINAITVACNNPPLFSEIAGNLVYTTLKIWIMTQTSKSWQPLQKTIAAAFNVTPHAIIAAQDLFIQITVIMQKFYYPSRTVKESKRQLGAAGQQTAGHISRSPDWRAVRDPPEQDTELLNVLVWDAKNSLQAWMNVRGVYSDLGAIVDVSNFAKTNESLAYIVDYLLQQDASVPYESLSSSQNRPLILIDVFGPILCEIAWLSGGENLAPGKAIALGALCRIAFRQTDPIPEVILEYVYSALARELENSSLSQTTHEIISNSGVLFSLSLPGAKKMIPYYLASIKAIVESTNTDVQDSCWRNCITIVCSLICFADHFPDFSIAMDPKKLAPKLTNRSPLVSQDLKELVVQLLTKLVARVSKPEHIVLCLCGFTTFVMNECRVSKTVNSKKIVSELVSAIIQKCSSDHQEICRGALQCMATLAMDCKTLESFDPGLLHLSVQGIANSIVGKLSAAENDKKVQLQPPLVMLAFETLEDWVLIVPSHVIQHHTVSRSLFGAIEMGLFGLQIHAGTAEEKTALKKGKKVTGKSFSSLRSGPSHGSKEIAEVAEVLLRSMLNLHAHWPGPGGPELTGTMIKESGGEAEKEDSDTIYFLANGSIVTLVPSESEGTQVRVIVRDEADRYAWDASVEFDDHSDKTPLSLPQEGLTIEASSTKQPKSGFERGFQQPPTWKPDENAKGVDKIDELLKYLGESYDDCKYQSDTIEVANEIKHLAEETARLMDDQQDVIDRSEPEKGRDPAQTLYPPFEPSKDPNHWTRLFLSHFNMVDYDQREWFAMLESGVPMQRSINTLDTKRAREAFKVGVIYVRNGQDSQETILRNETRSQYFDAFMRALAWEVNMGSHKGYVGGLDTTKFLTGTTAPYYSTPRLECMFHDITCMPTDSKDEQQIHKKRHVGNDVVNIVFSEHVRDYDPSTISTQFNCAHIICYPLSNGLYRIQICRKEEQVYPLFGPLLHNMCVTGELIALLARQTALNANRNFTSHKAGYLMPFPNRAKDVKQLVERYKENNDDYTKTVLSSFKK